MVAQRAETAEIVVQEPTGAKSTSRVRSDEDVWAAVAVMDKAMFADSGWFVIGPDNGRVPGVVVAGLEHGLRLVAEPGARLALVGRLLPGVVAVDVDVHGERGWAIAEQIMAWCRARDLWCLLRPSGGADGRSHVFVAGGDRADELEALASQLRRDFGVRRNLVDVRDTVRPLCSPHRTSGVRTLPVGLGSVDQVRVALGLLQGSLRAAPTGRARRRRGHGRAEITAFMPRPRPRRPLPPEWARWFSTGLRPALGGDDQSRSTYELAATTAMIRAGYTVDAAWDLILAAHPQAMSKARQDRRWWVNHIWNHMVLATEHETGPRSVVSPRVAAGIKAAADFLDELLWSIRSVRVRASVWAVAMALFDRMAREDRLQVPCAERDLVKDVSGITDRKTIRTALEVLHGRVGILHTETHDTHNPWTSYEFEVCEDPDQGVGQFHPPVLTSPGAPTPQGGVRGRLLHHVLSQSKSEMGIGDLAHAAYQTPTSTGQLTPDQARGMRQLLTGLQAAGWVTCDTQGRWRVTVPDMTSERVQRERAEAAATHDKVVDQIERERAVYRRCAAMLWAATRRAAIDEVHTRYKAWWAGLSVAVRAGRAGAASGRFRDLSPVDQAKAKHEWATRRARAGIDEAARHAAWLASMTPAEYTQRRQARLDWFHQQPAAVKGELVRMWQAHRARHSSHPLPSYPSAALASA